MKELHVINGNGERITMSWEKLRRINEDDSNPDKYFHDVDWYLAHGYSLIDDVIEEFQDIVATKR